MARIHTQIKAMEIVKKQEDRLSAKLFIKNWEEIRLRNKIDPYSAMKINAKSPLLNSVLNPETNSDSPSEKSKGVRLVSATHETIQRIHAAGNNIEFIK